MPERIRIGLFWYRVIVCDKVTNNGHDCYAKVEPFKRVLKIAKKGLTADIENTLIHEILHALSHQASLGLDEDTIWKLANGLEATLADNPGLMALCRQAKGEA